MTDEKAARLLRTLPVSLCWSSHTYAPVIDCFTGDVTQDNCPPEDLLEINHVIARRLNHFFPFLDFPSTEVVYVPAARVQPKADLPTLPVRVIQKLSKGCEARRLYPKAEQGLGGSAGTSKTLNKSWEARRRPELWPVHPLLLLYLELIFFIV